MHFLILLVVTVIINVTYIRYVPVRGIVCINRNDYINNKGILLLDLRDYNEAAKNPVNGAYNLPLAYLRRHHATIQRKDIVIIAPDLVSKNIGTRFLKGKGFNIKGYSLTECDSNLHIKKCCTKGGTLHGV